MIDAEIARLKKRIAELETALASTRQEPAPPADAEVARWMMEHSYATWEPIETAPTEPHSKYLGWCEFGDPRSPDGEARIITLDYNGVPYAFGCQQTVRWWMPLPESPAARVKSSEKGAR